MSRNVFLVAKPSPSGRVTVTRPALGRSRPRVLMNQVATWVGRSGGRTTSQATGSPVAAVDRGRLPGLAGDRVGLAGVADLGAARAQVDVAAQGRGQGLGQILVRLTVVDQQPHVGAATAAGPDGGEERRAGRWTLRQERLRIHGAGPGRTGRASGDGAPGSSVTETSLPCSAAGANWVVTTVGEITSAAIRRHSPRQDSPVRLRGAHSGELPPGRVGAGPRIWSPGALPGVDE